MAIRRLDTYTIEQIAAGEVIESPVSIVKELFENSIDAKSTSITVEIKNGGKTYIRVTDDGVGISPDDIELAFEKHATSKIVKFDDLYDIYSLGFRGEALASIVSVSDVIAVSKTAESPIGSKIEIKGANKKVSKIATNTGTSIEVFDLFKNLPVRKKFLKSDLAETNTITKLMYSLAIGYLDVSIKYIKDSKVEFKTSAHDPMELRISNLLDDNLKENLIEIAASNDLYQIRGYISSSNYYRGSRAFEYIYVNNRLIDNNLITETIEREYRSYIPQARFPAFFIFIETNPKNIDVNVHPNKRVIKFNYEDELLALISSSVHQKLRDNLNAVTLSYKADNKDEIADFRDYEKLLDSYANFSVVREDSKAYEKDEFFDSSTSLTDSVGYKHKSLANVGNNLPVEEKKLIANENPYFYLTSFFSRYSLFIKNNDKITILDHRRADEAIKFDKFLKEIEANKINSQMLLSPIVINLKANDKLAFEQKRDYIEGLGLDIDVFGDNQIIIRSLPQVFDVPESEDFFYDLLDIDFESQNNLFYKKLFNFVKSTSFRKGDKINKDEAEYLMTNVLSLTNPYQTFDGKAIMIEIDKAEVEKYFD